MDVNYGIFPKILVGISTALSLCVAGVALFSHPLGFLASIIILGVGGGFNSVIHTLFAPEVTYAGDPEPSEDSPEAQALESANSLLFGEELAGGTASRILGPTGEAPSRNSRLLTPVYRSRTTQPKRDPEAERRKEDAEWAEMFRAL